MIIDESKLAYARPKTSPAPEVFFTADISPQGLDAVYKALMAAPEGRIAVKLSTGEPPNSNYLRPELVGDFIRSLGGKIVECNTAYGGARSTTADHYKVAEEHGYSGIAPVDIMDGEAEISIPVVGGDNLKENFVGANLANYDYCVVLTHFKGHMMAGFGGSIKNISIGIASAHGKGLIHTGGKADVDIFSGEQEAFLESMAEAAKSVVDYLHGKLLYINVMNRLSVDCDCDGNPHEPDMHDIGILASYDPVAIDQACVDLVYAAPDNASLVKRMESRHGIHTVEQAAKIGLGSREYRLINLDN